MIISPFDPSVPKGFRIGLDNGAWGAYQQFLKGKRSTAHPPIALLMRLIDRRAAGADFIVVPDIVMGGAASLAMSRYFLRKLRRYPAVRKSTVKLLIAVQDGFEPADIERFLGPKVGIFVGGSTEWKEETMAQWARLARSYGAICHCGRVNTARRIFLCDRAGVHSFDGSSASRYSDTLELLERSRQIQDIEGYIARSAA